MGDGGKVKWVLLGGGLLVLGCGRTEREGGGSDAVSDGTSGSGGTVGSSGQGLVTSSVAVVTGSATTVSTTTVSTTGVAMGGAGGNGSGGAAVAPSGGASSETTGTGGTEIDPGSGGAGNAAGAAGAAGTGCDCDGPSLLVCGIDGETYDAKCGKGCVPVEVACNRACPCAECQCTGVFSNECEGSENDYRCRTYELDYAAAEAAGCRMHGDDIEYGYYSRPVGFCCPIPTTGLDEALCGVGRD